METYKLERIYLETETLGSIYSPDGKFVAKTMELPDKNNAHNISCIPEGNYIVIKEFTSQGHIYPHFRVLNVPNRNGILIHRITYVSGLKGCIGVGAFKDLNGDGVPDIVDSSITLQKMYDSLPEKFLLQITKKPI